MASQPQLLPGDTPEPLTRCNCAVGSVLRTMQMQITRVVTILGFPNGRVTQTLGSLPLGVSLMWYGPA